MLHVLVCDPSKEFVVQAATTLKQRIHTGGLDACLAKISLGPTAVLEHLKDNQDIHYAVINLLYRDAAGMVRSSNRASHLVFSAEHADQIHQAFEGLLRPSGIHIKPVKRSDIISLFDQAYSDYLLLDPKDECISVSFGTQLHRIRHDDILFIEAAEKKIHIVTKAQRLGFYGTLDTMMRSLPSRQFLRVHKGFIANRNRICEVDWHRMMIRMSEQEVIPISRTYRTALRQELIGSNDLSS